MKYTWFIACFLFFACKSKKAPDVSNIKLDVSAQHFETDFFNVDTNNVNISLSQLQPRYPSFLNDFVFQILGAPQQPDSVSFWTKRFIRDYKVIEQEAAKRFSDLEPLRKDIIYSFQLTKHYFPKYELPHKLISFVGPVEGYGTVLTADGVGIGLQQYLGKDFPLYQTDYVRDVYAGYQVRRFEPVYMPVNVMKAIAEDMFPAPSKPLPLIEIMIEQGKKLYFLNHVMPNTSDTLITGYTKEQLDGCYANEGMIWNFFIQNDLLYQSDPFVIRDYINDGPKTTPLGEASPGNIGQFVGWQIVKKFADVHERTLEALMRTPAKEILAEAKYKPR